MGFYDRVALSRMIRWAAFSDRAAARRSLDELLTRPFDRLIVGHGAPSPPAGGRPSQRPTPGWGRRVAEGKPSTSIARRREPVMTKQERTARQLAGALFLALFFLWGAGYNCFSIFLPSMLKQFYLIRLQVGRVPGVHAITAGASPCMRVRPRANRVIALEYLPRG